MFFPSVGGIETVSFCLAEGYVKLGHDCTVITRTKAISVDSFPFTISRNPSSSEKIQLILSHDIIHCNGASLELVFLAFRYKKPIVWTHAGYQLISIDGLGWYEGNPSPLSPWRSYLFHKNQIGFMRASKEFSKLWLRRFASHFITKHVAITKWVANRQNLSNQIIIYNPFPLSRFANAEGENHEFDFFFLGRLVSEKGVGTFIRAFALFLERNLAYNKNILVIGDGNWRLKLEAYAKELKIDQRVRFVGKLTGDDLLTWVEKGKIAVIPSEWEEPMGGVALEMLSAGKPVIVSENGGLAEIGRAHV